MVMLQGTWQGNQHHWRRQQRPTNHQEWRGFFNAAAATNEP
jgi:hypothetical protein